MKKLITLSALLLSITHYSFAQAEEEKEINTNDTLVVLKVTGMATEHEKPLNGATIALYKENEEMEWEEVTSAEHHDHNFSYSLLGNSHYTIRLSKEGFYPRSLSINTSLPKKYFLNEVFVFEFDVDLIKITPGSNDYYYDFPIALIRFNYEKDDFEFSEKYTLHIKKMLGEKMKDQKEKLPKQKNSAKPSKK
jgi:hypothetical protein